MGAFDDADLTGRTGGRRTSRPRSAPLAAALLVFLTLFCLFAAVAPAGAVTAPGRPTAKAPKGAINTTRPTFKWSKAARAAKYEVRVYKGRTLKLKKTGITRLSWKSSKTLARGVSLTWKVRGRNAGGNGAWSKRLTFKVRAATKAITAFSFQGLSPPVTGTVTEAAHTIALTVPFGTNVSALVATFTTTGASVKVGSTLQASGTTANNFTSPLTYRVTAANASTQDYTVTVTVAPAPAPAPSSAKAITAFNFVSPAATGVINETLHTIALTVPFGTDVSALVATFTTSGASVAIAGTPQTSGLTADNFSNPVTYTVTAADSSTQAYVVTVTVAAAVIGQDYGGGKIAYILQSGDLGYSTLVTHGLIAAATDQSAGIVWAIPAYQSTLVPGGTLTAIGTGSANTDKIIAQNGAGSTYAAGLARAYTDGVYTDWYLPSKDELHKLYLNRVAIGGFDTTTYPYWSSSEFEGFVIYAWSQYFGGDDQGGSNKFYNTIRVRAVRAF